MIGSSCEFIVFIVFANINKNIGKKVVFVLFNKIKKHRNYPANTYKNLSVSQSLSSYLEGAQGEKKRLIFIYIYLYINIKPYHPFADMPKTELRD